MPNYMTELSPDNNTHVYQIKDKEAAPIDLLKDTVGWIGKNLLHVPSTVTTQEINGVTWTITRNANGEVTEVDANGTATADSILVLASNSDTDFSPLVGESLVLSGCPLGGSYQTYLLQYHRASNVRADLGSGIDLTIDSGDLSSCRFRLIIINGYTANHVKFYPLLRDASILDDTYEPYHESVEEVVEQVYADNGVLGAKNLLKYPYNDTSKTSSGITIVDNGDGTLKINAGTVGTSEAYFIFYNQTNVGQFSKYIGKRVILSGAISSNIKIVFWAQGGILNVGDVGNGIEFTMPDLSSAANWNMTLYISANTVISNDIVIYPMLRLASDPDDTYVPYAMTNRELTEVYEDVADTELTLSTNIIKKCGKIVTLNIGGNALTINDWGLVGTIPIKYRPNEIITVPCWCDKASKSIFAQILTTGRVQIYPAISGDNIRIAATWITS